MSFFTIIFLCLVSILEGVVIFFLIEKKLVVCNAHGVSNLIDAISWVAVKNIIITGCYQIYFWPQNNYNPQKLKILKATKLDNWIPAIPQAYWIYSPFYYMTFSIVMLCVEDYKIIVTNGWLMLLHACIWFITFPTKIDKNFRKKINVVPCDKFTKYIMNMVHSHDSEGNACPSVHCAFAIFVTFIMYPFYPLYAVIFPVLVSISCLICKQHLIKDILPGIALGAFHGYLAIRMS